MNKLLKISLVLILFFSTNFSEEIKSMYNLSRKSCVKVFSIQGNSSGSGCFISDNLVATCFHVVANIEVNGQNVSWNMYPDIKIFTSNGEEISATCISLPNQTNATPLLNDFAILELSESPRNLTDYWLELAEENISDIDIGSICYFSGYPLAVPTMITQQGHVSGIATDKGLLCVQGSINKGNSGGGLINGEGKVIGIVSMKEGGISKGLQELTEHIESTSTQGKVIIMRVNQLQSIKAIIETLDTYISTGIGYAHDISYLKEYCNQNNINLGSQQHPN